MSRKITLFMPERWSRNKAMWLGRLPIIGAVAFNPWHYSIGVEVLAGYGKGLALMVGPLWLALAVGPRSNNEEPR